MVIFAALVLLEQIKHVRRIGVEALDEAWSANAPAPTALAARPLTGPILRLRILIPWNWVFFVHNEMSGPKVLLFEIGG